ncbi:MAG: hypothetical protein ACLU38_08130 [Dysosmobacter sp.]
METITNLIKDTPIPKMVKVRQNFDKTCILESDIPGIITRELDRPEIGGKIQPGRRSPLPAAAAASITMP